MAKANSEEAKAAEPLEKLANLLALLLVKDMPAGEQVVTLARARFGQQEIANLLDTTYATVRQTLYAHRKGLRKKKKPTKES